MKSFSSYMCRFVAALAASLIVFAGAVATAHAETRVDGDSSTIYSDTVWDESGNPYIVTSPVTIPAGRKLTIGPGVSIEGSEEINGYNLIDAEDGELIVKGTSDKPVSLSGYGGILIARQATGTVIYADISLPDGISVFNGSLSVSSTTIVNASNAVHVGSGQVSISNSHIIHNDVGIWVEPAHEPVINPNFSAGDMLVGGDSVPAAVRISNSELLDNLEGSISNLDSSAVEAIDNWWGSNDGPLVSRGPNSVKGAVDYEPWLIHATSTPVVCCSSVLFIPGLEASRIYSSVTSSFGTTPVQGWEPLSNTLVKSIYLNPDGSSMRQDTFSGDPIGKAYGLYDIYGTFMKFLDGLAANGTIGAWKAFGYDWRKPIAEVVAGPEKKATSTESLIDMVMTMASSSKTGKVTLIGHSNGGLVTKYLVKTLADMGKANLIDKVISVAVPYLGTPLAVPSLLYGDGMSFGYGLLLKQSVAQKLGVNMASAYSLLPSATYFSQVLGPTIAYASGSTAPVTTASAQDSLIGTKLNKLLMAAAESLHAVLDPFAWPASIERWALVGWGNDTVKSMVYTKNGSDSHTASTTRMGDSTVIVQSAAYNAGTTTALDLVSISKIESKQFNHQNILSASTTEAAIADIIEGKTESLDELPGVSLGSPSSGAASRIVVSTHSPVDLHVYDQYGNHTGIIPAPAGSGVTDDVVSFYETKIPGSSFEQNGGDGTGDDTDTEISLPADSNQKYSVSIQGNDTGEFTYEVQRFNGDTLLSDTSYSGLPTTPLTAASTTIDLSASASTSAPLSVDVDGDGIADIIAKPGTKLDPSNFFEALRKVCTSILGSKVKRFTDISSRIDKIEALFKKDKTKKIVNKLNGLESAFGHRKFKSLTQSDKDKITDLIDQFMAGFEK